MLTRKDFRHNFILLACFTKLRIIPVELDLRQGILQNVRFRWKRQISNVIFGAMILQGCYINLRLLQALLSAEEIIRHHLVFHVDLALASFMIGGWYLACFILHPGIFIAVFNEILVDSGNCSTSSTFHLL